MYQREIPARTGRKSVRRRSRCRRRNFPFSMLVLAIIAFALAYALQPDDPAVRPQKTSSAQPLTASALPDSEPPRSPSGGVEPSIPSGESAVPAADSWALTLVNPWNALPENYEVSLKQLPDGHAVDERCYPDLQAMMDACRQAGLSPLICSSYRSWEKQEALFQNKVDRLIAQGYSEENAAAEAAKAVAVPGTSEHQLGLAVDIVDVNNQLLDESQESTAVQQWLIEHSWEYGFILRYPNDKSEITGIIYEPWHYRYIGIEAAKEVHELGICLEEYLAQ